MWTKLVLLISGLVLCHADLDDNNNNNNNYNNNVLSERVTDSQVLTRSGSPYIIRSDVEISRTGSLTIESGVVLNFYPGTGLLVKGAFVAKVT